LGSTKESEGVVSKKKTQPDVTVAAVKAGKFRGVKSGMRVMEFQDWQLAQQPKRRLTDVQLLDEMKREFPQCTGKIFTADLPTRLAILRGVRALFNAGKHSKGAARPEQPVVEVTRERGAKPKREQGEVLRSTEPMADAAAAPEPEAVAS
jgi:hypothetical protein